MVRTDTPDALPVAGGAEGQALSDSLDALRTPLAVISGRAQLLERQIRRGRMPSPEEQLVALAIIQRQVRMLEMQLRVLQASVCRDW